MSIKYILTIFAFWGFGFLSSAGVFTVFVTVGLVPRLADKTHTASKIMLYESAIVMGAITGCILSVFNIEAEAVMIFPFLQYGILMLFGIFSGIFVGCFAIAIAEMLNTIPIFSRRISLGKGMGIALFCMALGKTVGSLIYFFLN